MGQSKIPRTKVSIAVASITRRQPNKMEVEVFDEPSDIGDPAAAGYPSGYSPQELDDNDEDYQRAVEQSRQAAFAGSTGYEAYPPGYGQGETSYSQHGTTLVWTYLTVS